MREQEMSSTAVFAVMVRAAHQTEDSDPKILADPVSLTMAQHLHSSSAWAGFQKLSPAFLSIARSALALRSRYAEDVLKEIAASVPCQYLILGAGFDTFAWRQPTWASTLSIFEVDHPATQASKRALLQEVGLEAPANLYFCAIDFENTSLRDGLTAGGFDFQMPAVVSWLGVTQYLSHASVRATFEFVRTLKQGSTIVFSFIVEDAGLAATNRDLVNEFATLAAARGEPFLSRFTPTAIRNELLAIGYRSVCHLSPAEAEQRYYADRSDGLHAPVIEQLMRATV